MNRNSAEFEPTSDDVFSRIAHQYDFLCDIFSLYAHRIWKRRMVEKICALDATTVLDVASGTGDIALRVAKRINNPGNTDNARTVIASDVCPSMLSVAKRKVGNEAAHLSFQILDAHDLKVVSDNSVDVYAISFAMKICDRTRVLPQALRVLRPGGVFMCLEASHIPLRWLNAAYLRYMEWCIPVIARFATGGDRSAYDYLIRGIRHTPTQKEFKRELETVGFVDVEYENMTFGIVAMHMAKKPCDPL